MAHFKRKKCRHICPKAIRGSDTSWRARMGMKPIRIDPDDIPHWSLRHTSAEWDAMWHPRGTHGNRGKKISCAYSRMGSYPAWWDRTFHSRPRRAAERRIAQAIKTGKLDPDETTWPLSKRPHIYYW